MSFIVDLYIYYDKFPADGSKVSGRGDHVWARGRVQEGFIIHLSIGYHIFRNLPVLGVDTQRWLKMWSLLHGAQSN